MRSREAQREAAVAGWAAWAALLEATVATPEARAAQREATVAVRAVKAALLESKVAMPEAQVETVAGRRR